MSLNLNIEKKIMKKNYLQKLKYKYKYNIC